MNFLQHSKINDAYSWYLTCGYSINIGLDIVKYFGILESHMYYSVLDSLPNLGILDYIKFTSYLKNSFPFYIIFLSFYLKIVSNVQKVTRS